MQSIQNTNDLDVHGTHQRAELPPHRARGEPSFTVVSSEQAVHPVLPGVLFANMSELSLITAATFGDVAALQLCLAAGTTIHETNSAGETALMHACSCGRSDAIEFLLASGARVSDVAHNGDSALHFAARAGHIHAVHALVDKIRRAQCQSIDCGKATALHVAARHGHSEVAYFLMEAGAASERRDANGNTALQCALAAGQAQTASFLIECGCNLRDALNADHDTGLHLAAEHGFVGIAKSCLEAGLDLRVRNRAGLLPIHVAARNARSEMCFWLMHRQDSEVDAVDNRGFTPLHYSACAGNLTLVRLFLSFGADAEAQNWVGR